MIINRSNDNAIYTGHVSIDPPGPVPLFGYASRKGVANPDLPALEANWVAYPLTGGIGLLISLDTLFSSKEVEAGIVAACAAQGVTVLSLQVFASHTHFAPALDPQKPRLGVIDAEYLAITCTRLAQNVAEKHSVRPTKIGALRHGAAQAPGSVFRRAWGLKLTARPPFLRPGTQILPDPSVDIPRSCRVWIFEDENNTSAFALVSWPCHPVARADPRQISADYIGAVRQAVRETLEAPLPVLFVPGASADIRPWFRPPLLSRKRLYPFPLQRCFGSATKIEEADFDAEIATAVNAALKQAPLLGFEGRICVGHHAVPLSVLTDSAGDDEMGVAAINLFGVVIMGLGAEVSMRWLSVLGWDEAARDRILTGYTGPVFGYLPTDAQIPEGGYEVDGFRTPFGFTGRYSKTKSIDGVVARTCETALKAIDDGEETVT